MPRPNNVGIGVGVVVFNDKGCVLMGIRKGAHAPNTWSFPGGWVDYEDPTLAGVAQRELLEETGLKLSENFKVLGVSTESFPEQTVPFRTVTVYLEAEQVIRGAPTVPVQEPEKCFCWAWLDPRGEVYPTFAGIPQIWETVQIRSEEIAAGGY
jgi:8-oxo-dGTP diphosphatase